MSDNKIPLAGVIGHPVAHSKSPNVHGYWLRKYGLKGHYVPIDIAPEKLADLLPRLADLGFVGANVTIPHKEKVMEIADLITDRATLIGAANTLIFRKDGRIHADNTDGYGFIENIRQTIPDWNPKSGPAVVFGAGGASRAVLASLIDVGVPKIMLTNRTRIRAEKLREDFGHRVQVIEWVQAGNVLEEADLVVNTTSLGMTGKPEMRVPLDGLKPGAIVNDLVYAPLRTRLLATAEDRGCRVVDGLGMLLHQAVPGFERWFGKRPVVDENVRAAVLR
ncbi:shikimate dehydrogenase [Marivita geojedonensis]|uniref:Shikimate dehydrogenase (NADP(+)) n=1 Tax=Marivita geojedonensis TaxID=1123756 RepID=A0A1X4NJV3_9RHOB|nr:shikimate dehydrogenase [Marivita geojedonensis]OSQ49911.1 shikimate dehydrogenase [Marivita geojedonensis]PRY76139.1 shikimate dehydrogenase [Marivita geojedonensis]